MKTNLLIAAVALAIMTPAIAQFKVLANDSIVASPKHRDQIEVRAATPVVTVEKAGPTVFASPRALETLPTQTVVAATPVMVKSGAVKNCCAATKVAASPKALDAARVADGCCSMNPCMIACAR
jgi:hypothetical protein